MSAAAPARAAVRPVAVVSVAQSPSVRREDHRNEIEMLMPVVTEVFANIGVTKADMGFVCSGSTDPRRLVRRRRGGVSHRNRGLSHRA